MRWIVILAVVIAFSGCQKRLSDPYSDVKNYEHNATYQSMNQDQKKRIGEIFWGYLPDCGSAQSFPLGAIMVFGLTQENRSRIVQIKGCAGHMNADPFVGVNYEPGYDVDPNVSPFQKQACAQGIARQQAQILAGPGHLRDAQVNVPFGPVADVGSNRDSYVYNRAFSDDFGQAADCTAQATAGYLAGGVHPMLKHFPGHGGAVGDTHGEVVKDYSSASDIQSKYLQPFARGFEAGSRMVMVAHVIYEHWDSQWPATLSPSILGHLRSAMGFSGIAVTDDMDMDSVEFWKAASMNINGNQYDWADIAILIAFMHGNDMIMVGNTYRYQTIFGMMQDALQHGAQVNSAGINVNYSADQVCQRFKQSAARINAIKSQMGLRASNAWNSYQCGAAAQPVDNPNPNPAAPPEHPPTGGGQACPSGAAALYVTCGGALNQACFNGQVVNCQGNCRQENPHGLSAFHDICTKIPSDSGCEGLGDYTTCKGSSNACVGGRYVSCPGGCVDPYAGQGVAPPYHDKCQ